MEQPPFYRFVIDRIVLEKLTDFLRRVVLLNNNLLLTGAESRVTLIVGPYCECAIRCNTRSFGCASNSFQFTVLALIKIVTQKVVKLSPRGTVYIQQFDPKRILNFFIP